MPQAQPPIPPITLSIIDRALLEDELDRAVETAVQQALAARGRGILVTRHDHNTFTVEVSERVAQGTIVERDLRLGPTPTSRSPRLVGTGQRET